MPLAAWSLQAGRSWNWFAKVERPDDITETVDCSQHVVLPGLVNTHHHFYQTLTRAHPDAINKELFDWLKSLYPIWGRAVNRDSFRLATRLALTELLMSGCTTVSDHHYVYPGGLEDAMDIQVEEAEQTRHADDAQSGVDGSFGKGWRFAAGQCCAVYR